MKKTFKYVLAVVAAVSTVACSQFDEQDLTPEVGGNQNLVPMTITVGNEASRVNIGEDNTTINWTAGDKLAVYEGTSTNTAGKAKHEFSIVESSINGSSASFRGEVTESATQFRVLYPSDAVESRSSNHDFNVVLPSVQQLGEYNIAEGALISVGEMAKTDGSVSLQNIVGFLRVDVTFDDVEKIVVSGNQIAGSAKIGCDDKAITSITTGANSVTLLPNGEVFTPGSYWVALYPSTTAAGDFSVQFNRTSGTPTKYASTKDVVIERNKGFHITDYKWVKSSCTISNAEELVNFLSNTAKYGKAELAADINLEGVALPAAAIYDGEFDGKGFALKNWNATAPLFTTLVGSVKNLTIDESCTLTAADAKGAFGFVAATVKAGGLLEGITNNVAAITLNTTNYGAGEAQLADAVYFGVLAGECYGAVKNCVNNSNITITTNPTGGAERGLVYIGGLVGLLDTEDSIAADNKFVSMSACQNNGNIAYTIASGRGGYLFLGGLVGGTTASKLATSTTVKANIDGCTNKGTISHIYPDTAIAVGASNDESNYTNIGGVVGYCEGSVSNCINGVKGTSIDVNIPSMQPLSSTPAKGTIIVSTPTLTADYVVARLAVAGVAGYAMIGGEKNNNYAPISVSGSFGNGNLGSSYAGGGAQKGVSVAGVVAQTGCSTYFKSNTLSDCHNHGAITCSFNMTSNGAKTLHHVGGVVAYNAVTAKTLTNNAEVTVTSNGYENYLGGVVGNGAADMESLTNNADLSFTLSRTESDHLSTISQYLGGVVGNITTGITLKTATNNNALTFAVNGAPEKAVYFGGVAGSVANGDTLINNGSMTITDSCTEKSYVGGIAAKAIAGTIVSATNNGTISYTGGDMSGLYVGGVFGTAASTSITGSSNTADVTVGFTKVSDLYLAGVMAEATDDQTYSGLSNSGAITLDAATATIEDLYAAGVGAYSKNASVFDNCSNSGALSLTAASATNAYFGGIAATPSSTSYAPNATNCTNSGDMTAAFAANWYVGGVVAYGGNWSSTTSKKYSITGNTVTSDISISSAEDKKLYAGGIVGHSGMHITYTDNSYTGTISTTNTNGFVGGMVGSTVLSATSANTNTTYYNYSFSGNSVNATLPTSGYSGAFVGGQYNSSTSTVKSAPIFKYIFDTVKPNTISTTTNVTDAVSAYRDDARFTVTIEGLEGGVVVK